MNRLVAQSDRPELDAKKALDTGSLRPSRPEPPHLQRPRCFIRIGLTIFELEGLMHMVRILAMCKKEDLWLPWSHSGVERTSKVFHIVMTHVKVHG